MQPIGVQQVDAIALVRKQVEAGLSTCRLVGFNADETCKPRSRLQLTVATDKLEAGIVVGVLLSGVFFTFKVSRLLAVTTSEDEQLTYRVSGHVFFASADLLVDSFDVRDVEGKPVVIDLSAAHFWDIPAVNALEKGCQRLRKHGSLVKVVGMNEHSRALVSKLDLGIE